MQHVIYDTTVNNLPVEGTTEESSAETQSGGHNRITCPGQGPMARKETAMTPREMALTLARVS